MEPSESSFRITRLSAIPSPVKSPLSCNPLLAVCGCFAGADAPAKHPQTAITGLLKSRPSTACSRLRRSLLERNGGVFVALKAPQTHHHFFQQRLACEPPKQKKTFEKP